MNGETAMLRIGFFVLFLIGACSSVFAASGQEVLNLAGVGAVVSTSPYDGVKNRAMALPFLSGEYKDFYLQGVEAGYRFYKKDAWTWSAIVTPRFMGYKSDDSVALNGMEDRQRSMDAGLKVDYVLPWYQLTLSGKVLTDVLSRSHGTAYGLFVHRAVKGDIFRLLLSAGVRYQDKSLVDYYYGVRNNEVRADRPAYAPRGDVDPFADAVFTFGISKRLIVVTMLGVEFLGSETRKSPIVDENYVLSAAAGLTYRF
jgi:outer membrane protein